MKRVLIKLLSVVTLICMLAGPCALGEAAERAPYRVKLDIAAEFMGEMISQYWEACLDEHGCLQETERISLPGFHIDSFSQLGMDGLTLALNGGEARAISAEAVLDAFSRALFGYSMNNRLSKIASYAVDGALPDALALDALLPAELNRLREAAILTGLGANTESGFIANGVIEDVLNAFAAYLDALSADAQALKAICALKVWALADMTQAELEQMLPMLLAQLASEARAAAVKLTQDGFTSSFKLRAESGVFELSASLAQASNNISFDASCANKRLSVDFCLNTDIDDDFSAAKGMQELSLDVDFNDMSIDYAKSQKTGFRFDIFDTIEGISFEDMDSFNSSQVTFKYSNGAFEYSDTAIQEREEGTFLMERVAAYKDGAYSSKLYAEDYNGEFALFTLNADENGVRLDGRWYESEFDLFGESRILTSSETVNRDYPMHVISAEIARKAEGAYDVNARIGARVPGDSETDIEHELYALNGALDLNNFELKLEANAQGEKVFAVNAQAIQKLNGEAVSFTAELMGKAISGELGYETATSEAAGAIALNVLAYIVINVPGPGDMGEIALRYELPFDIVFAPDGAITLNVTLALGEILNGTAKLTLEPVDTPPAHVYGAPYGEGEPETLIYEYVEYVLALSERLEALFGASEISAPLVTMPKLG